MLKIALFGLVLGLLFLLAASVGIFIDRKFSSSPIIQEQPQVLTNELFNSQTASFTGVILQRNGQYIDISNKANGLTGTIRVSDDVVISKLGQVRNEDPSQPGDAESIELNKDVLINLELINGEYMAKSIQYTLPPPSLPPLKLTKK